MKHSIALITGATSGVGHAAARLLAAEGCREIIVTGRTLPRARETAELLAAETKSQIFKPLELDLDNPSSVWKALGQLSKRSQPIDLLLLNAGLVPGKKRVLTGSGIEASQAPLIGHHQLTDGLLESKLLSPDARIIIAGAEPARGGVPLFKYTDLPAFAAKYFDGDRTAAVEALLRSGPHVKYDANNAYADAKLMVAWWAAALAPATVRDGRIRCLARRGNRHRGGAKCWPPGEVSDDPHREPHSRHEPVARNRSATIPSGGAVRNGRLRAILCLRQGKVHRPNRGAAPTALA